MASGIQTQVGGVPAPGIAGDFASVNPNRFSVLSGPGGLVAGSAGVNVGMFGWLSQQSLDPDNAAQIVNSFGNGVPDGFVSRPDSLAIITVYLADGTMVIQQGAPVPLHSGGDFWVVNNGTGQALVGQKAYASFINGAASFAATGSPTSISLLTASIATNTAGDAAISMTGSIAGNILTVTAVSTGHLRPGTILTGPSGVASGTQVIAQLPLNTAAGETTGGVGRYALSIGEQTVASGTVVGTYGILTSATTPAVVGGLITNGAAAGTTVWGQLSATTWVVSPSQTISSSTITETTSVETKWIARSSGAVGEVVKMSEVVQ